MRARLDLHLKHPTNWDMTRWFRELKECGSRPEIIALEYVEGHEWEAAERGWIFWFRERGELLNIDPGGKYRHPGGKIRSLVLGDYSPPGQVELPPSTHRPAMMTKLRKNRAPVWNRVHFPMRGK